MKGRKDLEEAFYSSKSAKEMLNVFNRMEKKGFTDLGVECEQLAAKFHTEGKEPEKVLCFGKRALEFYLVSCNSGSSEFTDDSLSVRMSFILRLMGAASLMLKCYDESLRYLTWSQRNLLKLERDKSCPDYILLPCVLDTESLLLEVKRVLGRKEEAATHMRKILEVKQRTVGETSLELGEAYKSTYMCYMADMNLKEAHPFCVKALEIYLKYFGDDSEEVAEIRRHLSTMCHAFGEYDKARELIRLSESALKTRGSSYQRIALQVEKGNMLMDLGRYEEAVEAFNVVVSLGVGPGPRGSACLSMAKAYCKLGRFAEAHKFIGITLDICDRMDINSTDMETRDIASLFVSMGFLEVSRLYEMMDDLETALSFTRRMLAIPEVPQKLLSEGSRRLFSLIIQIGKEEQGVPDLEAVVEKLKEKFGPEHSEVGYAYLNLGVAYMRSGNLESAANYMAYAKDIMDVSLGPHHLDSLRTSQVLSATYAFAGLNRLPLAIEIQEQVVEGFKGLGSSEQDKLDEAVRLLNQMKVDREGGEVAEPPTKVSDQSKDGEHFQSKNSQCDISEEETVAKLRDVKLEETSCEVTKSIARASTQSKDDE